MKPLRRTLLRSLKECGFSNKQRYELLPFLVLGTSIHAIKHWLKHGNIK